MKGHTKKYQIRKTTKDLDDREIIIRLFTNGGDFYTVQTETTYYDEKNNPINLIPKYTRKSFRGGKHGTEKYCMTRAEKYFDELIQAYD